MLKELFIKDFAVIDDLSISFSRGLTVLSGETGAGKSVITQAVNLLLGGRANSKMIRSGSDEAEIVAIFEISEGSDAGKFMIENKYELEHGLIVRRIISSSNRHSVYINGRPATLQLLSRLTKGQASISGQRAHQQLLMESAHLMILDQFGGFVTLRKEVEALYANISTLYVELKLLEKERSVRFEEIELLKFQRKEIIDASIVDTEDDLLLQERTRLKNVSVLCRLASDATKILYGDKKSAVDRLYEVKSKLDEIRSIDGDFVLDDEMVFDVIFKLEDLARMLTSYASDMEMDDDRLEGIEERLDFLNKIKRKYGGSLGGIKERLEAINKDISRIKKIDDEIRVINERLSSTYTRVSKNAFTLSNKRKEAALRLSGCVEGELAELRMTGTKFEVNFSNQDCSKLTNPYLRLQGLALLQTGVDNVTFNIAPNVGGCLKPLASIASGGELSRLVLAFKAILAKTDSIETVVFDEVDAGIGGDEAVVVGKKLMDIASKHQVICITHLAQVAKYAEHHFRIKKQEKNGRVFAIMEPIFGEQRVKEIARMMGGEKVTKIALRHAKEIIRRR